MRRAVELVGDQPAIPGEDGFGFRNTSHFREPLPAEPLADFGERRALGIGKPELSRDVGAENSILGAQVFALEEQALVDRANSRMPATVPSCCFASRITMVAARCAVIADGYFDRTSWHRILGSS